MYAFGELLKGFRERSGVTQEEFASLVAVSRNSISAWESGRYPPGSRETVLRLAGELQLRPDETDSLLRAANYPLEYGSNGNDVSRLSKGVAARQQDRSSVVAVHGYLHLQDIGLDRWFELRGERLIIGRHPEKCDLVIPIHYHLVSRTHATIYYAQGDVYLEDTSSNGTYIDGKKINGTRKLRPGHHVLLGGASPSSGVCILEFTSEPYSTY